MRGYKYKLKPSAEQGILFQQFSGVCRLVYNLALEQRCNWYQHYQRQTGKRLNYIAQARELTVLRSEYDWIAAVSQTCQQQALRDLETAFSSFFAGRAKYPTPRKKGLNDSFRFVGRECAVVRYNRKWSAVRLPKIGMVKFRDTRPVQGEVKNVTVTHEADGWHVVFCCEFEQIIPANDLPAVGIDRGVANTLTLSTGDALSLPASIRRIDKSRKHQQRALARQKRGSIRRAKQRRRVAVLSARSTRIRQDYLHKAALSIARRFGVVVLEDLKIKNMTASAKGTAAAPGKNVKAKAGLNRSILEQGWGMFATLLDYKLTERGGTLHLVNPAHTSQICAACGFTHAGNRKSQAVFQCIECGHRDHADVNAAVNILRRNTASMGVEGRHQPPYETLTRKTA